MFSSVNDRSHPITLMNQCKQHICGNLRFSSCLKFLRSTEKDIKETNYYYGMALAAMIGLDAALVFGTSATFHQSLDLENHKLKELLDYTGFPSLKDMAECDAYSTILQWQILHPHLFKTGTNTQKSNLVLLLPL